MDKVNYRVVEEEKNVLIFMDKLDEEDFILSSVAIPVLEFLTMLDKNIITEYLTKLENKIIEILSYVIYENNSTKTLLELIELTQKRDSIKDYLLTL